MVYLSVLGLSYLQWRRKVGAGLELLQLSDERGRAPPIITLYDVTSVSHD